MTFRSAGEQAARLAALDVAVLLKPFDIEALLGEVRWRLAGAPPDHGKRVVDIDGIADDVNAQPLLAGLATGWSRGTSASR